ncbi:MAG: flagellar hook-basal body complex protein FliE [Magnetococcales bacterium]|nr:flagellar hook-basal body complex protein FliE [Magnetococcales bacterium]
MAINSIGNVPLPTLPSLPSLTGGGTGKAGAWEDFSVTLARQIKETDRLHKEAKDMGRKALLGNAGVSIHEAQIASSQAELHLRLLLQVRNKAVEVYREVMSMQA